MNNFNSENDSVQATYMSQAEANQVMELWARRQREDAERQAMVTVHDVAEATQLSPQEIQRLLQDVRSTAPATQPRPVALKPVPGNELWPAMVKVGPYSIFVALAIVTTCIQASPFTAVGYLLLLSSAWVVGVTSAYAIYGIMRLGRDARRGRAERLVGSSSDPTRMYPK